ncbi:LPS export ABC transporter periplasmic protein LptC [Methyloprofundus sp.]|uniref:LPS export ABC transporter periplasmic protein LptC n=1 Tax=Methyloprofundus sp. TaxID=2020875 RepID=UPI003D0D0E5D
MFAEQCKNFLFLFLIFLFSIWAVMYSPEHKEQERVITMEKNAQHFAVNYSKTQLDEFGLTNSKLTADFAANYSGDVGTELTNPEMMVYKKDAPPWVIRSKAGHISADGNQIFMSGPVFIDRAAAQGVREVNIKTSNLRVLPDRNYAETDDWAELVSGLDRISGVGMELFYQDPLYVKLLSNIKGLHEYY